MAENKSQIAELKGFISERLHAATSEILGAVERTIIDYEHQVSRLKEENVRHRSLLDIIVKSKISQKDETQPQKALPPSSVVSCPPAPKYQVIFPLNTSAMQAERNPPSDAVSQQPASKYRISFPVSTPNEPKCLFTSKEEFLKSKDGYGSCPYCIKAVEASETHLMKRHYLHAVHLKQGGIEKFVIPCMCKDKIQGRSHWHCPCCRKIIYRKCNFEAHLSKMHGKVTLPQSQDTEARQPSTPLFEEQVEQSTGPDQRLMENLQIALMPPLKEEAEQEKPPATHSFKEVQVRSKPAQQPKDQMGEDSQEPSHATDSPSIVVCLHSSIQDISEVKSVPTNMESSNHTVETGAAPETSELVEDSLLTSEATFKTLTSKKKKCVKNVTFPLSLNVKKSLQLPATRTATGSHRCQACGKAFHYMCTLKAHIKTHTMDKSPICGEPTESLVQHLQSHTRRNKCGRCGKQFSSVSRLRSHMRFHRPEVLNV